MPCLVAFVAVNGLVLFEGNIQSAAGTEGRLVGYVLQFPFKFPAAPAYDQELLVFAAMTMAKRAEDFVVLGLHSDHHLAKLTTPSAGRLYCTAKVRLVQ